MTPLVKNVYEAILKYGHDEDFDPIADENFMPTDAPAGSEEKIEVLRMRVQFGQPLWHDDDRVDYSGLTGFIQPQNHSEHRRIRYPSVFLNEDISFEQYLENQNKGGHRSRTTDSKGGGAKTTSTEPLVSADEEHRQTQAPSVLMTEDTSSEQELNNQCEKEPRSCAAATNESTTMTADVKSLASAEDSEAQSVSAGGENDTLLSEERFTGDRAALMISSGEKQANDSGDRGLENGSVSIVIAATDTVEESKDTFNSDSDQSEPAVISQTLAETEQVRESSLESGDVELASESLPPKSETLSPSVLQNQMTDSLGHQSTYEPRSQLNSDDAKVAVTQSPIKAHIPPPETQKKYTMSDERYQELLKKAIAANSILPSSLDPITPLKVFNPAKTA